MENIIAFLSDFYYIRDNKKKGGKLYEKMF